MTYRAVLRFRSAVLALPVALLAGCGQSAARVEGTVKYDGQSVDGGSIGFVSAGGQGRNFGGPIENGRYSVEAPADFTPGTYKVQIHWKKKTGKKVPTPGDPGVMTDETVQVIPAKYNSQSTLTADLKARDNTENFDLKK